MDPLAQVQTEQEIEAPINGVQPQEVAPVQTNEQWSKIQSALEQGYSRQEIGSYLQETSGIPIEEADKNIVSSVKDKVNNALEQGYSDEEVKNFLINKRYDGSIIDDAMVDINKPSVMDKIKKYQWDPNTPAEEVQDLSDLYKNVYGKYSTLGKQVLGTFDEQSGIEARREVNALNQSIVTKLQEFEYDAFISPDTGELMLRNEDGSVEEIDSSIINDLYNTKAEMGGAVAGAITGAKVGSKVGAGVGVAAGNMTGVGLVLPEELVTAPAGAAVGTVIGAVGGSMAGASIGKSIDMTINAYQLKEQLEAKLYLTQMKEAAIFDGVAGLLGAGVFQLGKTGLKNVMKAFDFVAAGNSKGAYKALTESMQISDDQAKELVTQWETFNEKALPGKNFEEKAISAISSTQQGAETYIKPVAASDPKVAGTIIKEIDERAKSLVRAIDTVADDNVGALIRDDLGKYTADVKEFYGSVKQLAADSIDGTDFRFDLDKIAIDPVMKNIEKGISNPIKREQFVSYAIRIENASQGRTFSDLVDLRQAVNEFKYSKSGLKKPDIDALNSSINKIDTQINKAVKEYMPDTGKAWTEQFGKAKEAYSKMKRVEDNILYKAITKKGATEESIQKATKKYIDALDGTFTEVLEKLPKKTKAKAEGAVIKQLTERYTLGESADRQAIHFPNLANKLKSVNITTPEARHVVKTVDAFANMFKNDVHLSKVSGNIATPKFQSYLTTDPIVRMKFEIASKSFNFIKKFVPGRNADNLALLDKIEQLMSNPLNAKQADQFIKRFPKESQEEMTSLVKQLQIEMAKAGEKGAAQNKDFKNFYKQSADGKIRKSKGALGDGIYLTDSIKNPNPASQVVKKEINMSKMATLDDISSLLGREVDPKEIRNLPELKEQLTGKGFEGINIDNKVMLFPEK